MTLPRARPGQWEEAALTGPATGFGPASSVDPSLATPDAARLAGSYLLGPYPALPGGPFGNPLTFGPAGQVEAAIPTFTGWVDLALRVFAPSAGGFHCSVIDTGPIDKRQTSGGAQAYGARIFTFGGAASNSFASGDNAGVVEARIYLPPRANTLFLYPVLADTYYASGGIIVAPAGP